MVVGLLTVDLHFPVSQSLKAKRVLLQRLTDRIRREFNVSVAEVDHQDVWQRTQLAIALVNTTARGANSTLDNVLNRVEAFHEAELLDHQLEIR